MVIPTIIKIKSYIDCPSGDLYKKINGQRGIQLAEEQVSVSTDVASGLHVL